MDTIFNISAAQFQNTDVIVVTDSSVYDTPAASYLSSALFYSDDNFDSDSISNFTSPGSGYRQGPWNLSGLESGGTYTVVVFFAEKFRAYTGQSIAEGDIIWYDNQFWVKISEHFSLASSLPYPDEHGTDFALIRIGNDITFATMNDHDMEILTELQLYQFFLGLVRAKESGRTGLWSARAVTQLNRVDYSLTKNACYSYTINRTHTGTWNFSLWIFDDYRNGLDPILEEIGITDQSYSFTLPAENNVYVIQVYLDNNLHRPEPGTESEPLYLVIYEYCSLEECFQLLIRDILCNETICDPSVVCDDKTLLEAESLKRVEIMKIAVLYFEMLMLIHAEQMMYLNKFTISDDRISRWQRASDNIKRINEILLHCGICGTGAVGQSGCESC